MKKLSMLLALLLLLCCLTGCGGAGKSTNQTDAEELWKVKSERLVGNVEEALVVAPGVARTAAQAPDVDGVVYLLDSPRARKAAVGDFVKVRLERVCGFDFEGEVL